MTLEQHLGIKQLYEEPPSYDEAKAILIRVYEKLGPIDANEILAGFEVKKLSHLDRKFYGLFIGRCHRVLGERN